mmetsp:Transcript_54846/g.87062  ORF Transcript_54846/g.87062 Transcript_54846/m.87062 type:complete len:430 (-) Transcript_54846:126-1415(-)
MSGKTKTIKGKKYDVEVLEIGKQLTEHRPLQVEGARKMWESALDGNKVTQPEKNSIAYIMENHDVSDEAKEFFDYWLNEKEVSAYKGGGYQDVDGVKCDKAMIQVAEIFKRKAAGTALGLRAAEGIWFCALDGKGLTKVEKETLDLIHRKYDFDALGEGFLNNKMRWCGIALKAAEVPARGERVTVSPDAVLLKITDCLALPAGEAPADSAPVANPFADLLALEDPTASARTRSSPVRLLGAALQLQFTDQSPATSSTSTPAVQGNSNAEAVSSSGMFSWLRRAIAWLIPCRQGTDNGPLAITDERGSSTTRKRGASTSDEQPKKRLRQSIPSKPQRHDVPPITLQELRDVFDQVDKDGKGLVSKIAFIKACRSSPSIAKFFQLPETIRQEDGSREKMEERFQAIDADSSREISWAEFLAYYKYAVIDF